MEWTAALGEWLAVVCILAGEEWKEAKDGCVTWPSVA